MATAQQPKKRRVVLHWEDHEAIHLWKESGGRPLPESRAKAIQGFFAGRSVNAIQKKVAAMIERGGPLKYGGDITGECSDTEEEEEEQQPPPPKTSPIPPPVQRSPSKNNNAATTVDYAVFHSAGYQAIVHLKREHQDSILQQNEIHVKLHELESKCVELQNQMKEHQANLLLLKQKNSVVDSTINEIKKMLFSE